MLKIHVKVFQLCLYYLLTAKYRQNTYHRVKVDVNYFITQAGHKNICKKTVLVGTL